MRSESVGTVIRESGGPVFAGEEYARDRHPREGGDPVSFTPWA